MKLNKKLLAIVLLVLVLSIGGYFAYTHYNISQTQNYLKSSQELKTNATIYFEQAAYYEKKGEYSKAIQAYQTSSDQISQALFNDKQALNTASGVYREYLDVEIQLLEKTAKLLEYKIYQNQYLNNSLNPGQEKVNPTVLAPYIKKLTSEVEALKVNQDQIKSTHPQEFSFLG